MEQQQGIWASAPFYAALQENNDWGGMKLYINKNYVEAFPVKTWNTQYFGYEDDGAVEAIGATFQERLSNYDNERDTMQQDLQSCALGIFP